MATQSNNVLVLAGGVTRTIGSTDSITVAGGIEGTPIGSTTAAAGSFTTLSTSGNATVSGDLSIGGSASFSGNVTISNDLIVQGDVIQRGQQNVLIRDAILDLAVGNSSTSAVAGGFTVAMNRTSGFTAGTVTDFTPSVGGGSPSAAKFTYTDAGTSTLLAAGDIVVITGSANGDNDGIYVVDSVDQAAFPQVVTIKGTNGTAISPSTPFAQGDFTAETGASASAYKVDLAVWLVADGSTAFKDANGTAYAKGTWVYTYAANASESSFTANGAYKVPATTLQSAYDGGATITTANATDIGFTLSSGGLSVQGSGNVDFGSTTAVGTFNIDATGAVTLDTAAGFSIDATGGASNVSTTGQNLTISTITSGTLAVTSAGALTLTGAAASTWSTSAGALTIDGAGGLSLESSAGTIGLGNDPVNQNISIGTGGTRTITVGSGSATLNLIGAGGASSFTLIDNNSSAMAFVANGGSLVSFDTTTNAARLHFDSATPVLTPSASWMGQRLTAGTTLSAGDVVCLTASSGQVGKADAEGGADAKNPIGVAVASATAGNPVEFATAGVVTVTMDSAPSALDIGKIVYLAGGLNAGKGTLQAPSASGARIYKLGILASGDGSATSVSVLLQPQFIGDVA